MNKKMTKSKGSKLSLSMMIAFNQSDSSYGWFNFLTGMTGMLCHPIWMIQMCWWHLCDNGDESDDSSNIVSSTFMSKHRSANIFSAYISDPLEYTLDTRGSLSLPPSVVPILSIEQVHTTKLGSPYSDCRKEEDHSLRNGCSLNQ